jgi:hypothetical protein
MKREELLATLHLVAFSLVLLSVGFLLAQFLPFVRRAAPLPITRALDEGERLPRRLPVVSIQEIRGGELRGELKGRARLFVAGDIVRVREDGTFAVDAPTLLKNIEEVFIPAWATHVASKRGRKYYDVRSREAEQLVPENRVYFRSSEEAEGAGFTRRTRKPRP